nr:hypothetical protein [Methylomicrobium sp. RS1]
MEDVLEVYQRPYQAARPVVCLDGTFTQLIGEGRKPLPAAPGQVERYDSVYVRQGVASLYDAFAPTEARRIAERRRSTIPQSMAIGWDRTEIELSALTRDLPERVGERADLIRHLVAWTQRRNQAQVKANWQFTAADARIKLRKLYPTFEVVAEY